jgi:hypothetical protein
MGYTRIALGIVLACVSTLVARTAFEISYRLGFYPEVWLADQTMGIISNNLAFWLLLSFAAVLIWVFLEFAARLWRYPTKALPRQESLRSDDKIFPPTLTQHSPPAPSGLYTKKWVLNYNPTNPRGRKNISFNEDGTIGEGRNGNEYRWSYTNGHLDIWMQDNQLQNRFKYDANTGQFLCTNDIDAKGNHHQVIYKGRD